MSARRVSYRYLVFSVLDSLKSAFSDADIQSETAIWWVKICVNKVKAKSLIPQASGSYLATFTDVETLMQSDGKNNILRNRKYIELPANIFDLTLDDGVNWMAYSKVMKDDEGHVIYCEPIYFQRTTMIQLREMDANPYEIPSQEQPYFVRINNRLYLAGVEFLPKFKLDMALYITESPYIGSMSLDDEVLLNDEQIQDVLSQCLALGRFMLSVPSEANESGSDERAMISKQAAMAQQVTPQQQDQ